MILHVDKLQDALVHSNPASARHASLQPSPALVLPSSHASVEARIESPQVD